MKTLKITKQYESRRRLYLDKVTLHLDGSYLTTLETPCAETFSQAEQELQATIETVKLVANAIGAVVEEESLEQR